MNRRIEQRFQVYSPAKVILLDDPERELICFLTDISAAGLRLLTDESLPPDGMIVVEAEDHLVLCDVRNSEPRGSRFAVGAEKIHMLSKMELPADMPVVAKIEALISDFHLRLRTELVNSKPALSFDPMAEERVPEVTAQHQAPVAPLSSPAPQSAVDTEPPPSLQLLSTEALPPILPSGLPVLPRPPMPGLGQFAMMLKPPVAPQVREIEPPAAVKEPEVAPVNLPPAVIEPIVRIPLPERMPVTAEQRRVLRTWSIAIGVIAGLLMLSAEAVFHGPLRASAQMFPADVPDTLEKLSTVPETPTVTSSGINALPLAASATSSAPVTPSVRHASLTVTDSSWVSACSDGKMVLAKLMAPHEIREIQFFKNALVRTGNAGGVQVMVDGKALGQMGERGMVRVLEVTPDGFNFLPPETGASSCRVGSAAIRK